VWRVEGGAEPRRKRPAYDPATDELARVGLVRLKATCEYDGTRFHGWQIQADTEESVQGALEARLAAYLKRAVPIAGSGRTDAGVSARAQVFHIDVEPQRAPAEILRALQTGLPPGVRVTAVELAPVGFHARHSCVGKRYSYALLARQASPFEARWCWSLAEHRPHGSPHLDLDLDAMRAAARFLVGVHDFTHFCILQPGDPRSPVRNIRSVLVSAEGDGRVRVTVEADRYLYKQMRMMVGTLAQVGLGKLSVDAFAALVLATPDERAAAAATRGETAAAEAPEAPACRPRRGAGVYTAPAHGLVLEHVFYAQPGEFGTSSVTPAVPAPSSAAESIASPAETGSGDRDVS
jgi:tRNA pseudouridine38-40 synthase